MNVNGERLSSLKMTVEKEQREVQSVRETLYRKAQKKEAKLERQRRKLLTLQRGAFEKRGDAAKGDFRMMMKYAKESRALGSKEEQKVLSLKKHSEKLKMQEAFFSQKLNVIEKLKSENELSETLKKSEFEYSDLEEIALLKNRLEEGVELREDSQVRGDDDLSMQEYTSNEQKSDQRNEEQGDYRETNYQEFGEQAHYESGEREEFNYETQSDIEEPRESLRDSFERALQWQNGDTHGLRFSYQLNSGTEVVVEVERSQNKELSLVVFFPEGNSKVALSQLRSRLAVALSSAGYSLSTIRGIS